MLKTTGLFIASAFGVNDDEVVGGGDGAGAESGSVVERKVGLIAPTKVSIKYANFAFSLDLASKLPEHTRINDHTIELIDNHLSHPQVMPDRKLKVSTRYLGLPWICQILLAVHPSIAG